MRFSRDQREGLTVPDYALLGLQKIARQAARDPTTIRCPRDGAVMRVLAARGSHGLDVQCPACQRRAEGVRPGDEIGGEAAAPRA